MSNRRGKSRTGQSYTDPVYDLIETTLEKKYGLPVGGMKAIRTKGERSNADQVSPVGARTVYQIMPQTRDLFLRKYGVDAYSSKEAAAEVAALHLRDDMRRTGSWEGAVQGYIGGPDPSQHGATTRAYVSRVTGKAAPKAGGSGIDWANTPIDQLADIAPGAVKPRDIPKPRREKQPSKEALVTGALVGDRPVVAPRLSSEADLTETQGRQAAAEEAEAARRAHGVLDVARALVEKNTLLNQLARALDDDADEGDPAWHKEYLRRQADLEAFAQDQDELDMLRSGRAQRSFSDFMAVQQDILARRSRNAIIEGTGWGTALDIGSTLLDPAAWIATAGVGKLVQSAGLAGRLARSTAEGAITGLGFTAILDASGETQSTSDYIVSGLANAAIGAALHPIIGARGADTSADTAIVKQQQEAREAAATVMEEARAKVGPDATPDALEEAAQRIHVERSREALDISLSDVGDENKFMTADEDALLTARQPDREAVIAKHGLGAVEDEAERAQVAEIAARADRMVDRIGVKVAAMKGKVLKAVGQESIGMTMIRSKSNVLKATAMQLTEIATGAAGRRRTAAIARVQRERMYMRHMIEYERLFHQYRRGEGQGLVSSALRGDAKREFDRRVFYELDRRQGTPDGVYFDDNPAVRRAADLHDGGMDMMRVESQHNRILGHERLGTTSRGYVRHIISARKLLGITDKQRQAVEDVLARQLNTLNEFSYIDRTTGEKITKTFDHKFSRKLAKAYLTKAMRRGNGSYDVPVNLHTSESADVIADALDAMAGLGEEEKKAILGKFSRGGASHTKGRLKLDLHADIGDGMKLGDLFEQDILSLYRSYARRTAGEVALAQHGIYGHKGLQVLREAAERTGATADELKAFDQMAAEFLNVPFKSAVRIAALDNLNTLTSAARLGGMGFTQSGEYGNGIAALGFKAVFNSITDVPRLVKEVHMLAKGGEAKNPILRDMDDMIGHIGMDEYQMTRMFDRPDTEVQLYNDQSIGLVGRSIRAGGHAVSVLSGHRVLVAVQTRGMAEQIVRKAVRYVKEGKESTALADMGITPEIRDMLSKHMDKIATFDSKGRLVDLDMMNEALDPHLVQSFATSVERGAAQIIQRTFTGETGPWAHNDFLKLLFKFRTFSLTAIEKQWGRNEANYGAVQSFAILMASMSFALPIHAARVQARTIGMSRKEREEYADKNMSALAIGRATLNYAASSGLLGDLLDVTSSFGSHVGLVDKQIADQLNGGGRGRETAGSLVPGIGMADDILQGTIGGQFKRLPKLLPGSNLPYVTPIITGLTPD